MWTEVNQLPITRLAVLLFIIIYIIIGAVTAVTVFRAQKQMLP
jgi:HAMP domain-containing protein